MIKYSELSMQNFWKKDRWDFKAGAGPSDLISLEVNLRTRTKLGENCAFCDSCHGVEMHHVKHIRKDKAKGFTQVLQAINRKQIPACRECHDKNHRGDYDGLSIKDLANAQVAIR